MTAAAMGSRRPGPSLTTVLAGLLTILISLAYLAGSLVLVVLMVVGRARADADIRGAFAEMEGLAALADMVLAFLVFIGVVAALIALWTLILGIKVLQRRGWARWMLFITFLIFLLVSLGVVSAAYSAEGGLDPALSPVIVNGAIVGAVFLLLLLPSTFSDFRRVREHHMAGVAAGSAPAPPLQPQPAADPQPPAEPEPPPQSDQTSP